MFENFSDDVRVQMDQVGASINYPPSFDVSKMKQERESECFREQVSQPPLKIEAEIDIKTGPELLMREKIEPVVKSEYSTEFEDDKIGLQVAISEVFTMRVNSAQTSSETSDGQQDFKKPKKRITKDSLRLHTNINAGVKLFACKVCNYRTWKKLNLKMHKTTHIGKKPLARGRPHSALENHLQTHTELRAVREKPFSCDICNFRTNYRSSLIDHKRIHTGEKPYKCDVCDYRATQQSALNVHMRTHNGKKLFKCDVCDYRSTQQSALKLHKAIHHRRKKQLARGCQDYQASNKSAVEKHVEIPTKRKTFMCYVCNYLSMWKANLGKHMRIHTGEKPFECHKCDYRSTQQSALNVHMKIHNEEKPLKCDVCDYRSTHQSALKSHKAIHMETKPFSRGCQDYQVSNNSAVEKHVKIPTEREPFVCDVCSYLTMWKTNFEKHMRTHTGEKPFECDKCDYRSTQQSALNVHMRTHTRRKPFVCDECDYKTSYKANLMLHKRRRHTDQKPVSNMIKNGRGQRKCTGGTVDSRSELPTKLVNDEMHGPIEPTHDELYQPIEPSAHEDTDLPTRTSNHPPCPVCLKAGAKMYKFCCEKCRLFWNYWKKGPNPPDCPGHRTDGEDVDCSGCRWGRYKMASLVWEAQMKKNAEVAKDLDLDQLAGSACDGVDSDAGPTRPSTLPHLLEVGGKGVQVPL